MRMNFLVTVSGVGHINVLENTNTRKAQCADCAVGLKVNRGLLWFPDICIGDIPPRRKYICLSCATKHIKEAKYRFGVGFEKHNSLVFNSIFLQYGGDPGILISPDTVIDALCGDITEIRKLCQLASIQERIQAFLGSSKTFCARWFNTKNNLTWHMRGSMCRGSTARFVYRRLIVESLRPIYRLLSSRLFGVRILRIAARGM